MSQPPGDEGKSAKDFEKDSTPSCLNSREEGARRGGRMGRQQEGQDVVEGSNVKEEKVVRKKEGGR